MFPFFKTELYIDMPKIMLKIVTEIRITFEKILLKEPKIRERKEKRIGIAMRRTGRL